MATITFKGNDVNTSGTIPTGKAPGFTLVRTDLSELKLSDLEGKKVILNIFPSLDTSVCASSVRRFNAELNKLANTVVLCVSRDLPFAHGRFCETEGLKNVIPASDFRNPEFSSDYGVLMVDGPLRGLLARTVIVIDKTGQIVYSELVPEIAREPDYEKALRAVR